ncbi:MAG TPA: hypothetical protein VJM08_10595 [Anaerolineales bacterium]|nr:hypothetical protein [Anaerolineales bacterium]
MKQCNRCGETKNESEFNIRNIEKKLLQYVCRDCQRQQMRDRYFSNRVKVLEINRAATQKSQIQAAVFIREYLAEKVCVDCGQFDIAVLTFDHIRGEKKYNISNMVSRGYSIETIKKELEKTEIVCLNCHMRREKKRRK